MEKNPRLRQGLWAVLATPFTAAGGIDNASMSRQIELATGAGSDGLVVLGVFGEATSLSLVEQREVVSTVANTCGDSPLVIGIAGRTTAVAIEQATNALEVARDSATLMLQINSVDSSVVVDHFTAIHAETGASVVLQDFPTVSGIHMSAHQILQVVEQCPFVTAIKAEAMPTPPAIAELTASSDVPVFGGLGGVGLIDELAAGAAGAMTGFSHPEGLRATIDAHFSGGFTAARAAWEPWLPLANFEAQAQIGLATRKMLLHRRGIFAHPNVRPPAARFPMALLALLERHLTTIPAVVGEP